MLIATFGQFHTNFLFQRLKKNRNTDVFQAHNPSRLALLNLNSFMVSIILLTIMSSYGFEINGNAVPLYTQAFNYH